MYHHVASVISHVLRHVCTVQRPPDVTRCAVGGDSPAAGTLCVKGAQRSLAGSLGDRTRTNRRKLGSLHVVRQRTASQRGPRSSRGSSHSRLHRSRSRRTEMSTMCDHSRMHAHMTKTGQEIARRWKFRKPPSPFGRGPCPRSSIPPKPIGMMRAAACMRFAHRR